MVFSLCSSHAMAETAGIGKTAQPVEKPVTSMPVESTTASTADDTLEKASTAVTDSVDTSAKAVAATQDPDGWEKLAGNHVEVVYIKPTPHGLDPNITGIDVRVVAQTKELFDYAEGIAMADCDIREVFPVSGDIYDIHGNTIDPMHIPLLKGLVYIRAFPQEAYDGLAERLCSGPSPIAEEK